MPKKIRDRIRAYWLEYMLWVSEGWARQVWWQDQRRGHSNGLRRNLASLNKMCPIIRCFGSAIPKGPPFWKPSFTVVAGNSSSYCHNRTTDSNPNSNRIPNRTVSCHCWKWLEKAAARNGGPTQIRYLQFIVLKSIRQRALHLGLC